MNDTVALPDGSKIYLSEVIAESGPRQIIMGKNSITKQAYIVINDLDWVELFKGTSLMVRILEGQPAAHIKDYQTDVRLHKLIDRNILLYEKTVKPNDKRKPKKPKTYFHRQNGQFWYKKKADRGMPSLNSDRMAEYSWGT